MAAAWRCCDGVAAEGERERQHQTVSAVTHELKTPVPGSAGLRPCWCAVDDEARSALRNAVADATDCRSWSRRSSR
jgi:hypothetical protein